MTTARRSQLQVPRAGYCDLRLGETMTRGRIDLSGNKRGLLMIALSGAFLIGGCMPREGKSLLPQPPPPARTSVNPGDRVKLLTKAADTLGYDAQALPGGTAAEHSAIMQRVFNDFLQIFPLLGNADEDRVLAQRLSIIQSSRAQLSGGSRDLSVEPAMDNALRAASAELGDLSHIDSLAAADVAPLLDKLSAQANQLDLERDADLHRVDVAVAVDLCSQIVNKFAGVLNGHLAAEQPATSPATAPAGAAK
jgi:hypothetical protein